MLVGAASLRRREHATRRVSTSMRLVHLQRGLHCSVSRDGVYRDVAHQPTQEASSEPGVGSVCWMSIVGPTNGWAVRFFTVTPNIHASRYKYKLKLL